MDDSHQIIPVARTHNTRQSIPKSNDEETDSHKVVIQWVLDPSQISPIALHVYSSCSQFLDDLPEDDYNSKKLAKFVVAGFIALPFHLKKQPEYVKSIEKWLLGYILRSSRNMIVEHCGWNLFLDVFRCSDRRREVNRIRAASTLLCDAAAVLHGMLATIGLGTLVIRLT